MLCLILVRGRRILTRSNAAGLQRPPLGQPLKFLHGASAQVASSRDYIKLLVRFARRARRAESAPRAAGLDFFFVIQSE